ncbi:hypothetical protein U1Q18_012111 [Sarracenia purpurea var. burkii]
MSSQTLWRLPIFSFLSLAKLFLVLQLPLSSTHPDGWFYQTCGSNFTCGSVAGVGYPFRGITEPEYCGHPNLVLNCQHNVPTIRIMNVKYRVLSIDPSSQTMKIAREDMMGGAAVCPQDLVSTTLDNALLEFASSYVNLKFVYGCPTLYTLIPNPFLIAGCNISGFDSVYLIPDIRSSDLGCNYSITVPVDSSNGSPNSTDLGQVLQGGFTVRWRLDSKPCRDCTGSKGRCGYDSITNRTTCYCPDPPFVSDICSSVAAMGSVPEALPTSSLPDLVWFAFCVGSVFFGEVSFH